MAHQHHDHHGHSVVRIVQGKSAELTFLEFVSKFKKSIWIICMIGGLSAFVGYLTVIHHPTGSKKQTWSPKPVVRQAKSRESNNAVSNNPNGLRNDKKAGKDEILKLKNNRNSWVK